MSVIGRSLNRVPVLFVQDCGYIPTVLANAASVIEKNVTTPELFQIQGSGKKVSNLLTQLNLQGRVKTVRGFSVHDVIEAMKIFLTKLPEPLLPDETADALIEACQKDGNLAPVLSEYRKALPMNYDILHFLMRLFKKVSSQSSVNHMDVRKLSTIFVLDVLKPLGLEDPNKVPVMFPADRLKRLPYLIMVVETLIKDLSIFKNVGTHATNVVRRDLTKGDGVNPSRDTFRSYSQPPPSISDSASGDRREPAVSISINVFPENGKKSMNKYVISPIIQETSDIQDCKSLVYRSSSGSKHDINSVKSLSYASSKKTNLEPTIQEEVEAIILENEILEKQRNRLMDTEQHQQSVHSEVTDHDEERNQSKIMDSYEHDVRREKKGRAQEIKQEVKDLKKKKRNESPKKSPKVKMKKPLSAPQSDKLKTVQKVIKKAYLSATTSFDPRGKKASKPPASPKEKKTSFSKKSPLLKRSPQTSKKPIKKPTKVKKAKSRNGSKDNSQQGPNSKWFNPDEEMTPWPERTMESDDASVMAKTILNPVVLESVSSPETVHNLRKKDFLKKIKNMQQGFQPITSISSNVTIKARGANTSETIEVKRYSHQSSVQSYYTSGTSSSSESDEEEDEDDGEDDESEPDIKNEEVPLNIPETLNSEKILKLNKKLESLRPKEISKTSVESTIFDKLSQHMDENKLAKGSDTDLKLVNPNESLTKSRNRRYYMRYKAENIKLQQVPRNPRNLRKDTLTLVNPTRSLTNHVREQRVKTGSDIGGGGHFSVGKPSVSADSLTGSSVIANGRCDNIINGILIIITIVFASIILYFHLDRMRTVPETRALSVHKSTNMGNNLQDK